MIILKSGKHFGYATPCVALNQHVSARVEDLKIVEVVGL